MGLERHVGEKLRGALNTGLRNVDFVLMVPLIQQPTATEAPGNFFSFLIQTNGHTSGDSDPGICIS